MCTNALLFYLLKNKLKSFIHTCLARSLYIFVGCLLELSLEYLLFDMPSGHNKTRTKYEFR